MNGKVNRHSRVFLGSFLILISTTFLHSASADTSLANSQPQLTQGKYMHALQVTNELLANDRDNIQLRFSKAYLLSQLNRLNEALIIFTAITKERPDLPEPYNNIAAIYASQGKYDKAREILQKLIDQHPTYSTAYENMGDIYTVMATEAYGEALKINNTDVTVKHKLLFITELYSEPSPIFSVAN